MPTLLSLKELADSHREAAAPGLSGVAVELDWAVAEIERLRDALQAAEDADQKAIHCEEHEPEMAPESCGECFPLADDARQKRWAALGINHPAKSG